MEQIKYPVRINHFLALKNFCSRRQADNLIKQKQVRINNRIAILGDKVNENDIVRLSAGAQKLSKQYAYIAYNKPAGIETHASNKNQKDINTVLKLKTRLFPIGRLDKDSHGLIILTNDGRITDKLLNPKYEHEKEYVVGVDKPLGENFEKRMGSGIQLDDFKTKKCFVRQTGPNTFRIILTEGKKRQIRRMCEALGHRVVDLKRIRIMNVRLGSMSAGQYRQIKGEELREFLENMGL